MAELHLFTEVDAAAVGEVEAAVRGHECSVAVVDDVVFQPGPGRRVVVVSSFPVGARPVAQMDRARIEQLLTRASISFVVIAVDTTPSYRPPQRAWEVQWKPGHHRGIRGWIAGVVSRAPGPLRAKVSGKLLSAHRTVYAGTAVAARLRSEQLHRARGGTGSSGTRVTPRSSVPAGQSSSNQAPQVFGLLNRFIPYGWALLLTLVTAVVFVVQLVMDWPHDVAVTVALGWTAAHLAVRGVLMRGTAGTRTAKLSEALSWGLATAAFTLAAVVIRSTQPDGEGPHLTVLIALCVALPGLALQFKLWKAGRVASWVIPLVAAGAASLAPVVGLSMYLSYTQTLGVPYDAVTLTTLEQAWAGASTMALWLLTATVAAGVIGAVQWWTGRHVIALGLCFIFGVLSLFGVLVTSSAKATRAAQSVNEVGEPADWYAISPQLVCVTSRGDIADVTPVFGPRFDVTVPHVLISRAGGRWLFWRSPDVYWTVDEADVSVAPATTDVC